MPVIPMGPNVWDLIAVFNALTDGTIYLGVANGFRGTAEGA